MQENLHGEHCTRCTRAESRIAKTNTQRTIARKQRELIAPLSRSWKPQEYGTERSAGVWTSGGVVWKVPLEPGLPMVWITVGQKSEKLGQRAPNMEPQGQIQPTCPQSIIANFRFQGKEKGHPIMEPSDLMSRSLKATRFILQMFPAWTIYKGFFSLWTNCQEKKKGIPLPND